MAVGRENRKEVKNMTWLRDYKAQDSEVSVCLSVGEDTGQWGWIKERGWREIESP